MVTDQVTALTTSFPLYISIKDWTSKKKKSMNDMTPSLKSKAENNLL